eukprot:12324479-Ditylum_brightwellii.AAC.1
MNFKTGERQSPSHPSCGGQVPEAEAKEEGKGFPVGNKTTTNKAERLRHLSSRTSRQSPSRKEKWEK